MHSCMGTLRCPDVLSAAGAGGTVRGTVRRVRAPASVLGPPGRRTCVTVRAEETGNPGFSGERMSQAEMGEFGARDPTTTELDFGFQERVLYNASTEHIIMIPSSARKYLGLASKRIIPCPPGTAPLAFKDAELKRKQVLDWKLVEESGGVRLRRTWTAKDAAAGQMLAARVQEVAADEGYAAAMHVTHAGELVTVDVSSPGIGGVTDNDFILAAKVDSLSMEDVVKPARKRTQFY